MVEVKREEVQTKNDWQEANQRYLMVALDELRSRLTVPSQKEEQNLEDCHSRLEELQSIAEGMPMLPALEIMAQRFDLSSFERDLLLLCAGVELISSFSQVFTPEKGKSGVPTFGAALSLLPDAHWSAIIPLRPLRYWRLLELEEGKALTTTPIKIDEWALHFLVGLPYPDHRLSDIIEPVIPYHSMTGEIPTSHEELVQRIILLFKDNNKQFQDGPSPIISLCGIETSDHQTIAARACSAFNVDLYSVRASDLPTSGSERKNLSRLWERDALLNGRFLLLQWDEDDSPELIKQAHRFLESIKGFVICSARDAFQSRKRTVIRLDVPKPTAAEQITLWENTLSPLNGTISEALDPLVSQFNPDIRVIESVGAQAIATMTDTTSPDFTDKLKSMLWNECRIQSRPGLNDLAQRVEMNVDRNNLILPEAQMELLNEVVIHVKQRQRVYEQWGFQEMGAHGLGITALFYGTSGTGKTLAAAVLANQLKLDLYRVDLSSIVSKYIGETEKNLRRIFDTAEGGGAILLFDEADALFGKRGEVKNSNDRYANMEVSYLLQRMESYRGLAILTSNMKGNMDPAFLRRLRFTVQFPFPEAQQRVGIWNSVFPVDTPTNDLSAEKLSQLNVTGGNIRNIALNAAFHAAEEDGSVQMKHLLKAARSEYSKLEKPLTNAEIKGWI